MANYDSIDLDWTWDGDYTRGLDGDLGDTRDDLLKSFRNELHTVVRSEFDDWQLHPNLATNLSEYLGEPNTPEIATDIQQRIITRIAAATVANAEDLDVRVVPVAVSQVLVIMKVNARATPGNNLTAGEPLVVSLLYDSLEDSIFFLEPSKAAQDYLGA